MQLYRYSPSDEMDYVLLNWRSVMLNEGDLDHTLSAGVRAPSQFLNFFGQRPLLFALDSFSNISHACWVEPCMGSVFLSYYVSRAARGRQKEKCFFLYDMFQRVFDEGANSIVGMIQERETPEQTQAVLDIHKRLGYTYAGRLPAFFDGKTAHLVSLTKRRWDSLEELKPALVSKGRGRKKRMVKRKDEANGGLKECWARSRSKRSAE